MDITILNDYPDILTPESLMKILKIGRNATYKLLQSGEIPSIRIGKQYRIPKTYLIEYFRSCYNQIAKNQNCAGRKEA